MTAYITIDGEPVAYNEGAQGAVGSTGDLPQIRSFSVSVSPQGSWATVLNKTYLVGVYETQASAIGGLIGSFFRTGFSSITSVESTIQRLVDEGLGGINKDNS